MSEALSQPDPREALLVDGAFSITEACAFLGLSRAQVYREMNAGTLAFVQRGRRRLVPKRAAIRLLAAGLNPGVQG